MVLGHRWEALLSQLGEEEGGKLRRSMGLKMEQLKVRVPAVPSSAKQRWCGLVSVHPEHGQLLNTAG